MSFSSVSVTSSSCLGGFLLPSRCHICQSIAGLPSAVNSPVPIYILGMVKDSVRVIITVTVFGYLILFGVVLDDSISPFFSP